MVKETSMKRCPFCTESLADTAAVCKRCKNPLPVGGARATAVAASPSTSPSTDASKHPSASFAGSRAPSLVRVLLVIAVVCAAGYTVLMVRDAFSEPDGPEVADTQGGDGPIAEIPVLSDSYRTGLFGRMLTAVHLVPKSAALQRRERAIVYFAGEGLRVAKESCSNGPDVMRVGGELSKVTRADAGYALARAALTQVEACRLVIVMRAISEPVDEGLTRSFLP